MEYGEQRRLVSSSKIPRAWEHSLFTHRVHTLYVACWWVEGWGRKKRHNYENNPGINFVQFHWTKWGIINLFNLSHHFLLFSILQLECTLLLAHGYANAFRAASEYRRQVKNVTNLEENVNIVEFNDHIWNRHEKCIQISTNMPSIGLVTPEITCGILAFGENKHNFAQ